MYRCFFLFLTVAVHSGLSRFSCFFCRSQYPDACINSAVAQQCGKAAAGFRPACYYRYAYDQKTQTDSVVGNCTQLPIEQLTTPPLECNLEHYITKECNVCYKSFCNLNLKPPSELATQPSVTQPSATRAPATEKPKADSSKPSAAAKMHYFGYSAVTCAVYFAINIVKF